MEIMKRIGYGIITGIVVAILLFVAGMIFFEGNFADATLIDLVKHSSDAMIFGFIVGFIAGLIGSKNVKKGGLKCQ